MTEVQKEFEALLLCQWPAGVSQSLRLAKEYHDRCEAYDRTVCTGPIQDGAIMPANTCQFALINIHASAVRADIICRARVAGIKAKEMQQAISYYKRKQVND